MMIRFTAILLLVMSLAGGRAIAQEIMLSVPDSTVEAGSVLLIPVSVTEMASEDEILSGEWRFTVSSSILNITGVTTDGTLLQGKNTLFNPTNREFAFSSADPVTGAGVLIYLQVEISEEALKFQESVIGISAPVFNEGLPAVQAESGTFRIRGVLLSPKKPSPPLVEGESFQFSFTGDVVSPVTWTSSNESIATVSSTGLVQGISTGSIKIFAEDADGQRDSTDLFRVEPATLLDLTVGFSDADVSQSLEGEVQLTVSDLTGLNITSGEISFTYTSSKLEILGYSTDNTLLENYPDPVINEVNNTVTVALAGTESLTGAGPLLNIHFRVFREATGTAMFAPLSASFNESFEADTEIGTVTILNAPEITIAPVDTAITIGESVQFEHLSGGTAPYFWTSSDSEIALIDENTGLATGLRRGSVEIIAFDSDNFESIPATLSVNDITVRFPDVVVSDFATFEAPLETTDLTGLGINSFEGVIEFDPDVLQFEGISQDGTLSDGYSMSLTEESGMIRFAGAGSVVLEGEGVILGLLFSVLDTVDFGTLTNLVPLSVTFNEPGPDTPTATLRPGNVIFQDSSLPQKVTLLEPQNGAVDVELQPQFLWQQAAGADTYEFVLSVNSDFSVITESGSGLLNTTYQVSEFLGEQIEYYWRVRATNADGSGPWSDVFNFITQPGAAQSPALLSPANGSSDVPINTVFEWSSSQYSDEYFIEIAEDPEFNAVVESEVTPGLTYQAQSLDNGTEYFWRVTGINILGNGESSEIFSFTTLEETLVEIDGSASSLSATSPHIADGLDASMVSMVLVDTDGIPVSGLSDADFVITLTGSAEASAVEATSTPGTYSFNVTNTLAETVTVTVNISGVSLVDAAEIVFEDPQIIVDAAASSVTSTSPHVADGLDASNITILLLDTESNGIEGLTNNDFVIGLTGSATASAVSESSTPGTYTFEVINLVAEAVTVTVTVLNTVLIDTPVIIFEDDDPEPVPQPPILTAISLAGDGAELQWEINSGDFVAEYRIYRGLQPGSLQLLTSVGSNIFTYVDTSPPDGVTFYAVRSVNSNGFESDDSNSKSFVSTEIAAENEWKLISIPITEPNLTVDLASVFSFENGYKVVSEIQPSLGYWMKTRTFDTEWFEVRGPGLENSVITLNSGWNIIGGLSVPLNTDAISDPQNILSEAPVYGYEGGQYRVENSIEPAKGYWIHATAQGEIDLNAVFDPNSNPDEKNSVITHSIQLLKGFPDEIAGSIVFSNGNVSSELLVASEPLAESDLFRYLKPPIPPNPAIDVRTEDDTGLVQFQKAKRISLTSDTWPVQMHFEGKDNRSAILRVKVIDSGEEIISDLLRGEVIYLHSEPEYLSIELVSNTQNITESVLLPNYPNPFNPSTTIHYRLQNRSYVKIEVFDISGRRVDLLADRTMDSGEYRIQFNAHDLASGIYFVRFQNDSRVYHRKITLIK